MSDHDSCDHNLNGSATESQYTPVFNQDKSPSSDAVRVNKIVFLGTGSAIPSPDRRNTSSLSIMLSNGSSILFDAGEATQHQIMRSRSVKLTTIATILVSHLHGDHCFGLFGLLCTMASQGREQPVVLIGPVGLRRMVTTVLSASGGFGGFDMQFFELEPEKTYEDLGMINGGISLSAYPLKHRVPAFGFVIQEGLRPGALDVAVAKAAGASGKQLGLLKEGKDITLDDGRVVKSSECVGAPIGGRRVALLQDTYDSSSAKEACSNVDLLIYECTYAAGMEEKAIAHGHSTSTMAGQFASDCKAHMLMLTHFSNRYDTRAQSRVNLIPEQSLDQLASEALAAYTGAPEGGPAGGPAGGVHAAEDFTVIDSIKDKFVVAATLDR